MSARSIHSRATVGLALTHHQKIILQHLGSKHHTHFRATTVGGVNGILPRDHRPHLGHGPSALEVPGLEVGQHAQAREDVQRSVHRVQVIAQPVERFLLAAFRGGISDGERPMGYGNKSPHKTRDPCHWVAPRVGGLRARNPSVRPRIRPPTRQKSCERRLKAMKKNKNKMKNQRLSHVQALFSPLQPNLTTPKQDHFNQGYDNQAGRFQSGPPHEAPPPTHLPPSPYLPTDPAKAPARTPPARRC